MNHQGPKGMIPEDTHPLDSAVFNVSDALSQRCSRRGVLARVGRACMAALGVGIAYEVLPVGRHFANADELVCTATKLCGFCGWQCGCAGCSGSLDTCPACACLGNSWSACCGGTTYRYLDCWQIGDTVNGPCSQPKVTACHNCKECCREQYPGTGPYPGPCPLVNTYMCTRVRATTAC